MAILQTIHARCHSAFVVAEHGCAVGYAINEFHHAEWWLAIFSIALLALGASYMAIRIADGWVSRFIDDIRAID
jgi:hypothetical protein